MKISDILFMEFKDLPRVEKNTSGKSNKNIKWLDDTISQDQQYHSNNLQLLKYLGYNLGYKKNVNNTTQIKNIINNHINYFKFDSTDLSLCVDKNVDIENELKLDVQNSKLKAIKLDCVYITRIEQYVNSKIIYFVAEHNNNLYPFITRYSGQKQYKLGEQKNSFGCAYVGKIYTDTLPSVYFVVSHLTPLNSFLKHHNQNVS